MPRIAIIAPLKPGSHEDAATILREGPPYELDRTGFERHSVFLSTTAAVFVFEGPSVESQIHELVDDPVRSAAFSAWGPLLEGSPQLAREEFFWQSDEAA
jgi:hypothetical protein